MARQVLPILGGVVGAFFGMPQLGFVVGGLVGQAVDPVRNQGPRLGELSVQSFDEGSPRAIIYGTSQCSGYVIEAGAPIKTTEVATGDKGAPKTDQEVVYRNYAIAICEGPIAAILRVWADDKLVYDVRAGSLMLAESYAWVKNKTFYLGGEAQIPDIFLGLNVSGVTETPAFRGTAYMFALLDDLTDRRGSIAQFRFEVARTLDSTGGGVVVGSGGGPVIISPDGVTWHQGGTDSYAEKLLRFGDRLVGYAGNGPTSRPSYSDDGGETWTLSTGATLGFTSGPKLAWANGNVMLIPKQNGLLRSMDGGLTWSTVAAAISFGQVVESAGVWYGYYGNNGDGFRSSTDNGTSWSDPLGNPGNFNDGSGAARWALNGKVLFGGRIYVLVENAHKPAIVDPGGSFQSLPPVSGATAVVGMCAGTIAGEDIWVAGLDNGAMLHQSSGPWAIASPLLGAVRDIAFDGSAFWALVMYSGRRIIYRSTDGVAWSIKSDIASDSFSSLMVFPVVFVGGRVSVASIVSDLHVRAGLAADEFDAAELTDGVAGLTLSGDYSAASAIDVLRSCYFFDKSEPGDKIRYPKRGKPVVLTLTIDDLVELPDLARREQVSEVPKKLHLHYANALAGYAPIKATYMRSSQDAQSTVENTVQVPVVLDVDEAARMAEKMFKVAATDAQGEIKISVPDNFLRLVPSDCIGLSLRGEVRRLRIDEIEWAEGVMTLTCRIDRQSAYTSVLTGIPIDPPTLPPSTITGDTRFTVLDVPARVDSEDDLHYLVAGSGSMPAWAGWAYQRSTDGGANYTTVDRIEQSTVMGELVDPVGAASAHYTDTANVVRVRLTRPGQVLEDQTAQQFLSEQGAFALQLADGSWEILQYLDAADEGGGVFALRTLHRGLLNTSPGTHIAGALFVRLDRATHVSAQAAWLGANLTHRGVTLGASPEGAAEATQTFQGNSQREWSVARLALARDGANLVTGTWVARHRFGSDVNPIASANFTGFRVVIDDGVSQQSIETAQSAFSFDASAMASPVTVRVSSLNRITGAGPATSGSI